MGPFVRDWRADRELDSKTIFCWLQSSSIRKFCDSFQGMYFCPVVGAQVTSWDGEGGGCSIWATDVGTTASIPNSVLCRAICEDMGPGALRTATLYHLQCECFLQFWGLCSLCCKAWNFSSDFWKALPRCPDTHCEFLTFCWICLQKISVFFCRSFNLCLKLFLFRQFLVLCWSFWWSGWLVSLFSFSPWMAALYSRLHSKGCSLFHLLD